MLAPSDPGRLVRQGLLNNLSAIVTLGVGLIMVPVMLTGLGPERYGAWLVLVSVGTLVMSLDFGLALIVTRTVARAEGRFDLQTGSAELSLARAAGGAMLLIGACGWVALAALGAAAMAWDGSNLGLREIGWAAPVLVGFALLMDQSVQYTVAVLGGAMRFGTANTVVGVGVLLRSGAVLLAVTSGGGIAAIAGGYAVGSVLTAVVAAASVQWIRPQYSLARARFDLRVLRPERHFGFATLLASFAGAVLWHVHPLAIGVLIGPGAVAAFHVGMRLPMLLSETNWRTAEVLFPAASRAPDSTAVRVALATGLRWLTLLVLPATVLGFVLAPDVLDLWLRDVPPGAVTVMRIAMAVIVLDAWAVTALQILWGLGGATRPAAAMVIAAVVALAVDLVLVPVLGALAAPLAIGSGLIVTSIVTLRGASARAEIVGPQRFAGEALGFAGAAVACAIAAAFGASLGGEEAILRVLLGGAFGLVAFSVVFRFSSELAPGRALLRESLGWSSGDGTGLIRKLRERGRSNPPLRSAWYLLIVLRERFAYRSRKTSAELDTLFAAAPDPWHYGSPEERARHALAIDLLDRASAPGAFARVLEIGCAEGAFTERLAPRCDLLISADVSAAALARARARIDWGESVQFMQFDLLNGTLPGRFSTIVVMDVLTYFQSGAELRTIRAKIVDALEPGGRLLVADVRQRDLYESTWWGRALLCGGYWICEFMAADERLERVAEAGTTTHVFRLLRRVH